MKFEPVQLYSHDPRLRQAWDGLMRRIASVVQAMRVTNATTEPMVDGHIVTLVPGKRRVRLAKPGDDWAGVLTSDCEPEATAICRTGNLSCVKFAQGQQPVEGQRAFLGAPEMGVAYTTGTEPIGVIADATGFSEEHPFAKVSLMRLSPRR
jgi:hypothetical protein